MKVNYPYVQEYEDDHGTRYIYYRRGRGRKVRIRASPGTAEFQAAYDEAKSIAEGGAHTSLVKSDGKPKMGTYRWLCTEYFKSLEFRSLNPETQRVRRNVLEATWREPWVVGSK